MPPRAQTQLQTDRGTHLDRIFHPALEIPPHGVRVVVQEAEDVDADDLSGVGLARVQHVDEAGGVEGDVEGRPGYY